MLIKKYPPALITRYTLSSIELTSAAILASVPDPRKYHLSTGGFYYILATKIATLYLHGVSAAHEKRHAYWRHRPTLDQILNVKQRSIDVKDDELDGKGTIHKRHLLFRFKSDFF